LRPIIVIAGLDPAIHAASRRARAALMVQSEPWVNMDARVKPAHDEEKIGRCDRTEP
jgi:hypothetical protein